MAYVVPRAHKSATLGRVLDWWEGSERRRVLRERLRVADGVDPDDVIMSPERAHKAGLTSTVTFPRGNLAPEGSVIKSTAIDPSVVDADGETHFKSFLAAGPPETIFLAADGSVAFRKTGPFEDVAEIERLVREHLGVTL